MWALIKNNDEGLTHVEALDVWVLPFVLQFKDDYIEMLILFGAQVMQLLRIEFTKISDHFMPYYMVTGDNKSMDKSYMYDSIEAKDL